MVFKTIDDPNKLGGKNFGDWDSSLGFLKNVKDKIYSTPTGAEIDAIESYKKAVLGVNDAYYAGAIDSKRLKEETEKLGKALPTDRLRDYATSGDAATKSQEGFKLALNKTTVAAGATKAMVIGLNAVANMGIMFLVSGAITLLVKSLDKWIVTAEEASEISNEVISTWKNQSTAIDDNIESVENMREEFKKLSRGVDENGKNVALSAEQYEKYQSIVSKVTELNPSLVKGYNDERVAILDKNIALDETITKLERELELEDIKLLRDKKTLHKDAKNDINDYEKSQKESEDNLLFSELDFKSAEAELARLQQLRNDVSSGKYDKEQGVQRDQSSIDTHLANIDYMIAETEQRYNVAAADRKQYLSETSLYTQQINDRMSEYFASVGQATLNQNSAYKDLDQNLKNIVSTFGKTLDPSNLSAEEYTNELYKIVSEIDSLSVKQKEALNKLFTIDPKALSADAYVEQVNNLLGNLPEDLRTRVEIAFDIDNESIDDVQMMKNEITSALDISSDDIGKLSIDDLKLTYTNLADLGCKSIDELIAKLNELKSSNQSPVLKPLGLEEANKLLDETQLKYQSLTKSIDEYNTSGIMTLDNMQAIVGLGNEYLQFMSIENGQIKMNREGLVQLALARIDDAEAAYLQTATDLVKTLTDEKTASDFLKKSTEDEAKVRLDNAEAAWEEAHALAAVNASKTGSTLLAEAIKTLEANVGNASAVFDAARNSVGSYTDATMGAANATSKLSDVQKELEDSLRAEGDAAIRVIDRKIKAIQDAQKASEEAIDAEIDGIKKEKEAYEKAIDAEIDKLNERKKALEDSIKKGEDAASVVVDLIQEQMDAIDKRKDEVNEFYDEQLDALEKVNKELQDQIDRENALEDLQKAKSQKVLIYRKGQGFVEAENEGTVKDAQDKYDKVLADQALQAEKDRLEEERTSKLEALDAEKKLLEEYQKLWSDSTSKYEEEMRRKHALEILGQGYEQAILEQRTDILDEFTQFHYDQTVELEENVLTQIDTLTKQKEEEAILFEERITALEEQKAREAENYAARIEDLNVYKESIQEQLNKIGKSWEEYQAELSLEAKWEAKLFNGMADEVENYASRVEEAMRRAQNAKVDGGYVGGSTSGTSSGTNKPSSGGGNSGNISKLATGGIVSETGWFITDENNKKEAKVGLRAGKATLLDKGDMVFPNGTNPTDVFSIMMSYARENPIVPARIQKAYDTMSQVINNTNISHKEEIHLQFTGDLSFPNITNPNDAQKLISALIDMGRESYQLPD